MHILRFSLIGFNLAAPDDGGMGGRNAKSKRRKGAKKPFHALGSAALRLLPFAIITSMLRRKSSSTPTRPSTVNDFPCSPAPLNGRVLTEARHGRRQPFRSTARLKSPTLKI